MDLNTITVAQFQTQFRRDFPYLPTYDSTTTYAAGAVVYYGTLFYMAKQNGLLDITPGSDAAKWEQTNVNALDYVEPMDITNAFAEAQVTFNQALFGSDAQITLAYLYATAHYLVNDLRTAAQGIDSAGGGFPVASRSVGSIAESYQIPDMYKENPNLAFFTSTGYGQKYLSMLLPRLVGNIGAVCGGTNP